MTEKAQRLLDAGQVSAVAIGEHAGIFVVKGDTRSYLVTVMDPETRQIAQGLGGEPATCGCEARGLCSHILAADAVFKVEG